MNGANRRLAADENLRSRSFAESSEIEEDPVFVEGLEYIETGLADADVE